MSANLINDPNATVNVSLASYQALLDELEKLRTELLAQRQQPSAPTDTDAAHARAALERALAIVQFAVGNLDPRTVRGWPVEDVTALANLIEAALPNYPHADVLAITLREFAGEAADVDRFRRDREKSAQKILGIDSSPVDESEETP